MPVWSRFLRLLLLVPVAASAVRAMAADAQPDIDRKVPLPFVEEFNDNSAGWALKFDRTDLAIRDGRLEFENLSAEPNSVFWISKEMEKAPVGDFDITLVMSPVEGVADGEAGLIFDLTSSAARRLFQLSRDSFRYDAYDGSAWELEANRFSKWPGIRSGPDARNELVFRVLGKRGFFLLNGTAVHAIDYAQPRSTFVGLIVSAGASASFDRLAVQPLKLADAARATEAARLEREARASSIAAGPKLEPFVETFDDNRNKWEYLMEDANWKGAIEGGVFVAHNRNTRGGAMELLQLPINDAADYEIVMRARNTGPTVDHQVCLVWGGRYDGSEKQVLAFSGDRSWRSYLDHKGKAEITHPWRRSTAVKPSGEVNELTVRKLGDTVFFLINGQVVGERPARKLQANGFGMELGPGIQAAIEEFRVTYPALSPEAAEKQKRDLWAALEAAHAKKEVGATSSVAARKEAEAKELASRPTQKDWDEQDKLDRRYRNKKMLSVLADRPNTARRTGSESAPLLYYHYRNIGGVDYYWEFQCYHVGGGGKVNLQEIVVQAVVLTSHIRQY